MPYILLLCIRLKADQFRHAGAEKHSRYHHHEADMSNSIVIRNALVVFSSEEIDVRGFLTAIHVGAETHEKRKAGCKVAMPPAIRDLQAKHVDEDSLLEACADVAAHFMRTKRGALLIDFYPESYKGDVSLRSLHFLVNRLVRPFVQQHKIHTFEVADWNTLIEDGRDVWVPLVVDFLEGMTVTESRFTEMLGSSKGSARASNENT